MTDEEKESLRLIAYRLGQLEQSMDVVKSDCKQVGQILAKLRLDEQILTDLRTQVNKVEHAQQVTDEKQDVRLKALEDIVMPRHESWSDTAADLRGFAFKITTGVLLSIASMAGIVGLG